MGDQAGENDFLRHVRDGTLVFLLVEWNSVSVLIAWRWKNQRTQRLLLHDETSEDRRRL
jgi:hypothetical protein